MLLYMIDLFHRNDEAIEIPICIGLTLPIPILTLFVRIFLVACSIFHCVSKYSDGYCSLCARYPALNCFTRRTQHW